jgi:hypothetical protein
MRGALLCVIVAVPFGLRHWVAWVIFGFLGLSQLLGLVGLLYHRKQLRAECMRIEAGGGDAITWVHAAPEARSKLHYVRMFEKSGENTAGLHLSPEQSSVLVAGFGAHAPGVLITTAEEQFQAVFPRYQLAAKLTELEKLFARVTAASVLQRRDAVERSISSVRGVLAREAQHPYRPGVLSELDAHAPSALSQVMLTDVMPRLERLDVLFRAAAADSSGRYFTDEIVSECAALEGYCKGA